jgi:hypothetical protein
MDETVTRYTESRAVSLDQVRGNVERYCLLDNIREAKAHSDSLFLDLLR